MTSDEREGVACCTDCDGSGHNGEENGAGMCERCQGMGEIVVDWALYLGCDEDDAAKIDAAWKRHVAADPK